ncbi:MAG: zf-HC2 domain-containing protein [Nostocaceae cyanobacterium]|nr:zf-HC2 domain-containing protein [Nostocaceae cyanobacterium]
MTREFKFPDNSSANPESNLPDGKDIDINQLAGAMDMLKRDRFELLSAYLDGEVTATERREVEDLLATDPTVQCLYARLLKLRQGLRTMPVPVAEKTTEETVQQVLTRVKRRSRRVVILTGTAVAAVFASALSVVLPGINSPVPQVAQQYTETEPTAASAPEPLMVAINNPVIEIPKAAVATPEKSLKQTESLGNKIHNNLD